MTPQEKAELEALLTKMMQPLTEAERQQFKTVIDRLCRSSPDAAKLKAFDKFVSAVCLEWLL